MYGDANARPKIHVELDDFNTVDVCNRGVQRTRR